MTAAPLALASTVSAEAVSAATTSGDLGTSAQGRTPAPADKAPAEEVFSTGVAKGRDRLDSATSTSALKGAEIEKFGARSLGEVLRNIPGIRVEYAGGEGNSNYSIRGLPLAALASKYLQLQEDGLPVLEFGDLQTLTPDMYMRMDLNVAQVEAIRGGSASTFASNSPGGVINLLSKTGETEGGAVQGTLGLNYGEYRIDADYGHKISDTLRFHVGGFYRQGEGPRHVGFDAYKGGQIKANITKSFSNGYIRLYGKYLDDRTPNYNASPIAVSGTNDKPVFRSVANFDIKRDSVLSPNTVAIFGVDGANQVKRDNAREGQHAIVKSIGFDAQFDFGGWSFTNKFRFADVSGQSIKLAPFAVGPAATLAASSGLGFPGGGAGATLSYANGPSAGQVITNPAALNGNGLLVSTRLNNFAVHSLRNITNDLRVSRVWPVGGGDLTTTAGFYKSAQEFDVDWSVLNILPDVRGGGAAALVNVINAAGTPVTQDGFISFGFNNGIFRRQYDVDYAVNAPYGSVNYHLGKVSIGGSLRYDMGDAKGTLLGAGLGGGRVGVGPVDLNGDGRISLAESRTGILPLSRPGKVDYDYHYLSYSTGINVRIAEPLAVFGRYSRGARAAADRLLFTAAISPVSGAPLEAASAFDTVKQAEAGLKFRQAGVTFNVTGFSAKVGERNVQVGSSGVPESIVRGYEAKGVEIEGGVRRGAFSLTAGGTYTDAKIASDAVSTQLIGNTPRHQAGFIFQATPQVETRYVTAGANIVGTTSSFAQDVNQLKMPGYTLVNAFLQIRPVERVQLMLNVNNVFDALAFDDIVQGAIPASGFALARAYTGRTASMTARYAF
ncbi:MAG TPA: TonB-dependent receptor [Sphingomonas sp.]|jgi:outer membrane receptor protein involved in Fe transport|uniref:TonB-dependent receptor domain-containing protein n=1 Tax=Sphingomonas sp. TaxID=28214 RepID=UPI002EDB3886